jgi:hypothetical protein
MKKTKTEKKDEQKKPSKAQIKVFEKKMASAGKGKISNK